MNEHPQGKELSFDQLSFFSVKKRAKLDYTQTVDCRFVDEISNMEL